MKKWTSLLIALALCLVSVTALAATRSPSVKGLSHAKTYPTDEDGMMDETPYIRLVLPGDPNSEELLEIMQKEIDLLAASPSLADYFGDVVDENGAPVNIDEALGTDKPMVYEFHPVIAGGYPKDFDQRVTVDFSFATPYEEGDTVLVLVGIQNGNPEGKTSFKWTEFKGTVLADNVVRVTFTPKMVLEIENKVAMLCIVSK